MTSNLDRLRELADDLEEESATLSRSLDILTGGPQALARAMTPDQAETCKEVARQLYRILKALNFTRDGIRTAEGYLHRRPDNATGPTSPAKRPRHT